ALVPILITSLDTFFHYTTLFRSRLDRQQYRPQWVPCRIAQYAARGCTAPHCCTFRSRRCRCRCGQCAIRLRRATFVCSRSAAGATRRRSEEHTSELQSRFDLVCRLLLEKKKGVAATRERVRRHNYSVYA